MNAAKWDDVIFGALIGASGALAINNISALRFEPYGLIPLAVATLSLSMFALLGARRLRMQSAIRNRTADEKSDESPTLIRAEEEVKAKPSSNSFFFLGVTLLILSGLLVAWGNSRDALRDRVAQEELVKEIAERIAEQEKSVLQQAVPDKEDKGAVPMAILSEQHPESTTQDVVSASN